MLAPTVLAFLALTALPRSVQETQQPASLLAALPGDTDIVLAIEDFATLWERAPRTAWGQLASEPVLAPLWGMLDELARDKFGDELTSRSVLDALQGAVFFMGSPGNDDEKFLGIVLRLRPGSSEVVTAIRAELEGGLEPVEFEGRTLWPDRGGSSQSVEVFFAWSEGVAVVEGRGRENALARAATLARKLEAGVSDGALTARLADRRPADRTTFEAYANVGSLIASSLEPYGEQDTRTYEALQLEDFGWATYHFALGEGSALTADATLELPRAGLWPLLAAHARPAPTKIARLAPAETIEVATLGYDVRGAWHSLKVWFALELPDFSEELVRSLEDMSSDSGFDLEREVFGQLSGEFGKLLLPLQSDQQPAFNGLAVSVLIGLIGTPGSAATSVYLVAVDDVAVVERGIDKLIKQSDASERVGTEDVAGHRLRFFEVPELQLDPSWAFVDGTLILSIHKSAVRSVLLQAADEPPYAWLDAERAEALRSGGAAFGSSVADLEGLTQVSLAAPLAMMAGMAAELRAHSGETDSTSLQEIAAALPGLVEKYVSGTARTTLSIDGRVLRYRLWTN